MILNGVCFVEFVIIIIIVEIGEIVFSKLFVKFIGIVIVKVLIFVVSVNGVINGIIV